MFCMSMYIIKDILYKSENLKKRFEFKKISNHGAHMFCMRLVKEGLLLKEANA